MIITERSKFWRLKKTRLADAMGRVADVLWPRGHNEKN